jgi:formylglycine-generating enzyme required for sulfatase activity
LGARSHWRALSQQRTKARSKEMATQSFKNIAETPASFWLSGGQYALVANAGTWGTAKLQMLSADNTTWLDAAAQVGTNGMTLVTIPAGQYRLLVTGATGLYVSIVPVTA